jgi:hypothetical protein
MMVSHNVPLRIVNWKVRKDRNLTNFFWDPGVQGMHPYQADAKDENLKSSNAGIFDESLERPP